MSNAMAAARLHQAQATAEHCIVGNICRLSIRPRPQFVGEPGVFKHPPSAILMFVVDKNPARQNADRSFENAHVLVEQQMRDFRSIEQCLDRGKQHSVIGADKLTHALAPRERRPPSTDLAGGPLLKIRDKFHLAPTARYGIEYQAGDNREKSQQHQSG